MTSDNAIAESGDAKPISIPQDPFEQHKVRYKALDDIYLGFWPLGCEGPSQTPDWELFDRKLDSLLANNQKLREATAPASTLQMVLSIRRRTDDSVHLQKEPRPEARATSDSEIELVSRPGSVDGLYAHPVHVVDIQDEESRNDTDSDYEWSLPETPPLLPALDDSWTLVAEELHSARTTLCFTMDCGDSGKMKSDNEDSKSNEDPAWKQVSPS